MIKQIAISFVLMLLAAGAGFWFATWQTQQQLDNSPKTVKKPLFYRNPMNPEITSPTPAKDEMGMSYIPVYSETDKPEVTGTVTLDHATADYIGVKSEPAQRTTLSHIIHTVGRVAFDEERMVHVHPKIEGWIEHMFIDKTGQWVKQNDVLLSIYSPQLVASQQEYILALNNRKALSKSPIESIRQGAKDLVKSSHSRLQLLDVPDHQIRQLAKTQKIMKSLHLHSPADGIVIKIGAREGQFITPSTELYMIADLSQVWVYADIYEYELPWVKQGDTVEMRLAGIPGRVFKGSLDYVYPYAEAKTRTIKVRLAFDNPELQLKPDMFTEITIHSSKQVNAIVIPEQAIIRSGIRNQVFVVKDQGKYEPRLVTLGLASNGKVAIKEGIKEGESVVTSAQFLIDSESKLREATDKMMTH